MNFSDNHPIILTLDAGGTNFVFSAVQQEREIVSPHVLPAQGHDLDKCLNNIIQGFKAVCSQLTEQPAAISFAFPGPADYARGIIGDLGNLPAFRNGVALGPMLEEQFGLPVFINNDGDLFAYGEAIYGFLPHINTRLKNAGSQKQFHNLAGFTLGTGFGGGLVTNGKLYTGDNGAAAEVWLLPNPSNPQTFAEESISIRAITRTYQNLAAESNPDLTPACIFQIAKGQKTGNMEAALEAFHVFGVALGKVLAQIVTLTDSLVVIGGGLANARELFFPAMIGEMNGSYTDNKGGHVPRLVMKAFDLNEEQSFKEFAEGESTQIQVPFSNKKVYYDPVKRIGVGVSMMGTSKAISLGAYAFATHALHAKLKTL